MKFCCYFHSNGMEMENWEKHSFRYVQKCFLIRIEKLSFPTIYIKNIKFKFLNKLAMKGSGTCSIFLLTTVKQYVNQQEHLHLVCAKLFWLNEVRLLI